jgi:hypothetical protein
MRKRLFFTSIICGIAFILSFGLRTSQAQDFGLGFGGAGLYDYNRIYPRTYSSEPLILPTNPLITFAFRQPHSSRFKVEMRVISLDGKLVLKSDLEVVPLKIVSMEIQAGIPVLNLRPIRELNDNTEYKLVGSPSLPSDFHIPSYQFRTNSKQALKPPSEVSLPTNLKWGWNSDEFGQMWPVNELGYDIENIQPGRYRIYIARDPHALIDHRPEQVLTASNWSRWLELSFEADKEYYIGITEVDYAGNESRLSKALAVTTPTYQDFVKNYYRELEIKGRIIDLDELQIGANSYAKIDCNSINNSAIGSAYRASFFDARSISWQLLVSLLFFAISLMIGIFHTWLRNNVNWHL